MAEDTTKTAQQDDPANNSFPPGSNGDTLNQHPAVPQAWVTALDVDPQREGESHDHANDPLDKPIVHRDLESSVPAPDPVDPPTPNRVIAATGGDLQQPTDADRQEAKRLREDPPAKTPKEAIDQKDRASTTRKALGGPRLKKKLKDQKDDSES